MMGKGGLSLKVSPQFLRLPVWHVHIPSAAARTPPLLNLLSEKTYPLYFIITIVILYKKR